MKLKRILSCFLAILISLTAVFSLSTPLVRANGETIPAQYYQQLDLNGTYVYNVTGFGGPSSWWNYTGQYGSKVGDYKTNVGGQIIINITGFFNRDPEDTDGDLFPNSDMSWMDVEIFEKGESIANFTRNNCSNSESAGQLILGYGDFKSGFVVPTNNFTELKALANLGTDWIWGTADLTIEESYNLIYFQFVQISGYGNQKTQLVYDKTTGLLVWANTTSGGYHLEIESLNFTYNFDEILTYNITQFGTILHWYDLNWTKRGVIETQTGNQIIVNITGFFEKNINDTSPFSDPAPYINITFIGNETFYNISNAEAASALVISYNNFLSGFMIPIENISRIQEWALSEKEGLFISGNVSFSETILTLRIDFDQLNGPQKTYMIYEKYTGLLLWTYTYTGGYVLEMGLEGYSPGEEEPGEEPPGGDLSPGDIVFLPYLIVIIASVAIVIPVEVGPRVSSKTKKYVLLAMIAISSFSGLLFFNNNMNLLLGSSTFNQRVDNIVLIVDYGNTTVFQSEPFTLLGGKTSAYDALKAWCDVELSYSEGLGYYVEYINGYKLSGWIYSITSGPALEVTQTPLNNGDIVRFTAV